MRLSASEAEDLYYGALLHDIGKIMIPLSILESPNRLDEAEMNIMRTHVTHTDNILRGIVDNNVLISKIWYKYFRNNIFFNIPVTLRLH